MYNNRDPKGPSSSSSANNDSESNEELPNNILSHPMIDEEVSFLLSNDPSDGIIDDAQSSSRLLGYREWTIHANWQLLVETFLESYHVKFLHQDTLGIVAHSNIMVTDVLDEYSTRMTVPLKNFDYHGDDDDDEDDVNSFWDQTTTTYHLFPNSAISIFKRFIMYLSISPSHVVEDSSSYSSNSDQQPSVSSVIRLWAVTKRNRKQASTSKAATAVRDLENVVRGIEEDWKCAEEIQRTLNAQRKRRTSCFDDNKKVESSPIFSYSTFEGNNVHFLQNVGKLSSRPS